MRKVTYKKFLLSAILLACVQMPKPCIGQGDNISGLDNLFMEVQGSALMQRQVQTPPVLVRKKQQPAAVQSGPVISHTDYAPGTVIDDSKIPSGVDGSYNNDSQNKSLTEVSAVKSEKPDVKKLEPAEEKSAVVEAPKSSDTYAATAERAVSDTEDGSQVEPLTENLAGSDVKKKHSFGIKNKLQRRLQKANNSEKDNSSTEKVMPAEDKAVSSEPDNTKAIEEIKPKQAEPAKRDEGSVKPESESATTDTAEFKPLDLYKKSVQKDNSEEKKVVFNKNKKKTSVKSGSGNKKNKFFSKNKVSKSVVNDLYLDKYKSDGKHDIGEFYRDKDITVSKQGDFSLNFNENERPTDKLIEEIESSDPKDTFTPNVQLTLRECIGIALAKHPDIMSAKINTDIYKARILEAWAAYFPNFSAGISYDRSTSRYPDYVYRMNSMYTPNISGGLLLFDFGKTKTTADIATADFDASKYDLAATIGDVIYGVKSAYFNLLFAQKQVEVYKKTIEDFELQMKMAKKYFEIGKKPQIDVIIAEYNEGNARLNLVRAVNTLEVARVTMANTLGLPEFANFELSEDFPDTAYESDLEKLLYDAFRLRPDLISYEKSVESSRLNVRRAARDFTPDLGADGSYYYGGVEHSHETNYRVGVNLSYSGLNLLQLKKEYDIAKKSYEKTLADYESVKQRVYKEVKEAYINLESSKNAVKQAKMTVDQAKAQNYHATGRYNAGLGDAIELKDSENTYLNAQLEYYQALLNYNDEAANIERLVGRPMETGQKL